ncbi:allantoicase NDAI_0F00950 [Naumovozyma dairenensis CBS 421]|uniref:Allantoicase domain-containing protein n=1 Tax=Naumovozyma dairenensis (strain ATCC 10597 / BCRC 20456 / CBS 421 / NBRC 0211 / NRRL Y-12639) TaxID=1071378 RepID=G0WCA3_NAUDC|nr:hypothetical protein NDAI_0F00950 [Naumovozyma dairenensis CBS 421]CCD25414.1 hypothetical protein NDAI_0F00950 [Naumovozyma dairenensis CBS 421]
MYPDGGIARFKLYGKVSSPIVSGNQQVGIDLASVVNGAVAWSYSDQHFGSADNLLLPGRGHDMSDGWETKRSRSADHTDWVIIKLGRQSSYIQKVIVDTAHYRGNFPQYITVHGYHNEPTDNTDCVELVGKVKVGPDQEHVYNIERDVNIAYIKLTIIPDGGVKRLRVWGR